MKFGKKKIIMNLKEFQEFIKEDENFFLKNITASDDAYVYQCRINILDFKKKYELPKSCYYLFDVNSDIYHEINISIIIKDRKTDLKVLIWFEDQRENLCSLLDFLFLPENQILDDDD